MYDYCDEKGIPVERCGKLIVATGKSKYYTVTVDEDL